MKGFSEKVFLSLKMPNQDNNLSDAGRIRLALETLGYEGVHIPLKILRKLYPMCRKADFDITVTLVHRENDWAVTCVEPGDTRARHYGLAVDYGSTTIVMELVDMDSGAVIAGAKQANGQIAYGTDILTRITYAMSADDHPGNLHRATVDTLNRLLDQLQEESGVDVRNLGAMVLSGNTTMIHFLLGLDGWTVFADPYAPVVTDPGFFWGEELGLEFSGLVYVVPAASNYVGGDIVSGLLTLELHKKEEIGLFFDIGTNGELVIGNRHWMLSGAGAAGPALEGYISKFGMRAQPGAVDSVTIADGKLRITTIGNVSPTGICGSGIVDLLAQMRLEGWMNIAGELQSGASDAIRWMAEEGQYVVVYGENQGKPLYFSQQDIHQYLDTKAAAYTMVECLLEAAGIHLEQVDRVYLSGAFAAHSKLESAITVGMYPDIPRENYRILANTSLEGARLLLGNRELLEEAKELAGNLYCVQFASIPDFLVRMQAAKFVPHTDMNRYPSVKKAVGS